MNMRRLFTVWFVVALLITACNSIGGKNKEAEAPILEPSKVAVTQVNQGKAPTVSAEKKLESTFPLPDDANIISSTPEMTIASTTLTINDAVKFYRDYAKSNGLTEYDLLTNITDTIFSMAFRVPNQEKELVIQGTVISTDNLTLSLRYEETDVK